MTQNNFRKEPTFGEPSTTNKTEATHNVAPSLHSSTSPGHTFTPHLKRPETAATEAQKVEEVKKVEPQKTAGFTFEPVVEKAEKAATEAESAVKNAAESAKSTAQEAVKVAATTAERVIPTAERVIPTAASAQSETKPAATASKGRRLGLVALLAAILGAVFIWLKPSQPETVEELQQQQGGSLPIEFRPVDEAEAQRAEAQAQAEREAAAQQAQQQTAAQPAQPTADNTAAQQPAQPVTTEPMAQTPAVETPAQTAETATTQSESQAVPAVKPVTPVKPEVQKPKTQGSVIHQAEHKPAKQPHIKAMTADEFNAKKSKNAQMDQLVKNVEAGKPVQKTASAPTKPVVTKPAPVAAPAAAPTSQAVATKTMTVPKSTSLMQVFRDNQLNISDVNAMSKVNGIVSKLKENEKVTVRLDKNNRVVEMSIGSGGKFTRQADGSYTFK